MHTAYTVGGRTGVSRSYIDNLGTGSQLSVYSLVKEAATDTSIPMQDTTRPRTRQGSYRGWDLGAV